MCYPLLLWARKTYWRVEEGGWGGGAAVGWGVWHRLCMKGAVCDIPQLQHQIQGWHAHCDYTTNGWRNYSLGGRPTTTGIFIEQKHTGWRMGTLLHASLAPCVLEHNGGQDLFLCDPLLHKNAAHRFWCSLCFSRPVVSSMRTKCNVWDCSDHTVQRETYKVSSLPRELWTLVVFFWSGLLCAAIHCSWLNPINKALFHGSDCVLPLSVSWLMIQ